ncbi:MAG: RodZ domain-containing protein [Pseudomonadota bacterium]
MDNDPGTPEDDEADMTVAEGLGVWLREARTDRALTTAAVAQALHLDVDIVEALESEAFESLGATVFAKGHVRAVATYLGLDVEEAARRFHSASGTAIDAQPDLIVQYHSKPPRDRRWAVGAVFALLLVLIAGLAWVVWVLTRDGSATEPVAVASTATPAETTVAAETAVEPVSEAEETVDSFAERLNRARIDESAAQAVSAAPDRAQATPTRESVVTPVANRDAGTAAPSGAVEFEFSASCWYEVRDAGGTRVAYGTAQPGLTRTIRGTRPLSVVIGVADAVTVRVDGGEFAITPAMRRGRTARFSIP